LGEGGEWLGESEFIDEDVRDFVEDVLACEHAPFCATCRVQHSRGGFAQECVGDVDGGAAESSAARGHQDVAESQLGRQESRPADGYLPAIRGEGAVNSYEMS
jgi:hypothetical protein